MIDSIQEYSQELIKALKVVEDKGAKKYVTHVFDCSFFKKYTLENIRESPEHLEYHDKLRPLTGPCLYWFEILNGFDSSKIREEISTFRDKKLKAVPAMKKKFSSESATLYVGKVKKNFWNRVIQHLGYYDNNRTQGLQLYHWANALDLKLKLHVYEFHNDMSNLMVPFENNLARKLKPILGKHS